MCCGRVSGSILHVEYSFGTDGGMAEAGPSRRFVFAEAEKGYKFCDVAATGVSII